MSLLKTSTKISNLEEQLKSIKNNVRQSNDELTTILKDKQVASLGVEKNKEMLANIKEEYSILSKKMETERKELDAFEILLNKKESDIELKNKRFQEEHTKIKTRIDLEKVNHQRVIENLKSEIKDREYELVLISNNIDKNKSINDKLLTDIKQSKNELYSIGISIEKKKEDINITTKELDTKLALKIKELNDISSKVEEEKIKIDKPLELLRIEQKKLDKRRKNLDTLIRRWKKWHIRNFPNQEIKL